MHPRAVRNCTMAIGAIALAAATAPAQSDAPLLLREPALSADQICFTFASDIWLVPRAGGTARRLTASPDAESGCSFSPDGKLVAYTGTTGTNPDVFVIPTAGGTPKQLTFHPGADLVRGWTPDGRVLFVSGRSSYTLSSMSTSRLFVQAVDAVAPTAVDLPNGWDGAFSPDGKRLAYMPIANANEIWKRYQGGRTTSIWIARLADASIERVPRDNSTDKQPMWVADTIFFLSDRDGATTLYSYDLASKRIAKRIDNKGLDIKNASAGPGGIVLEQFGAIRLYDLTTGKDAAIPIRLDGELTGARPHWVSVSDKLQHPALSPTGVRAAFEARGEIITVPARKGDARNITGTEGITERFPIWSPDGQTLAYFSDSGGPYHLEIRGQTGMGPSRRIALDGDSTYFYTPVWSPDGKRIAYSDSRSWIWIADVATGKVTRVDADPLGAGFNDGGTQLAWSPDSRWLSYSRSIANRLGAVFVYDVTHGKSTQVTDGMSDARSPAFDASGKYLYFTASTDAGPASDFSMTTFDHPVTRSLYAIVLPRDLPSPMAPESDEEEAKADSAARSAARAAAGDVRGARAAKPDKADSTTAAPEPVRIDFDAIDQRTVALPAAPKGYVAVVPGKEGILILAEDPLVPVDLQDGGPPQLALYKFDLGKRKTTPLIDGVSAFDLSRDGQKLLYKVRDAWAIASIESPVTPGDSAIATDDIQVATNPRAEWREMYHEAFRLQRAFFYDPNYHGLDLAATERYYARWLDGLGSRDDLDYLFREIFGNLTVGHLFVIPADEDAPRAPRNGLLGADYTIENGRWRFARVYAGENWNPGFTAPLTQPGVNVQAGEYLLAVNGQELTSADNVDHALAGTARKSVVLRVGANANGTGARDVTVVPLASETMLRHLAWIDANRRTVDKLSGGKLAYIYVPNTAGAGYTRFNRYFFAQQDKYGAVVDERFNGGGNIADYMIHYLQRDRPFNYVAARYGDPLPIPAGAIYGPKVMLINEYAGSGGDEFPWLFRRFKVGQIVGTRTWGGLVGIGG
ncbi:MAG TPA: PDZ domain-containing protein, partial [Gemmatimonadaceae bacterium]